MMEAEKKQRLFNIVSNVILALVLAIIALLVLFPLYYVLITSFKDYSTYISDPFGLSLGNLKIENYVDVIKSKNIFGATLNSVIVSAISVALSVVWAALASFALGVVKFKGGGIIYFLVVSTMFFTGEMVYVPLYLMYVKMGLLNTFWVLVIPYMIGISGLGVIMGTGFIKNIPHEIHEAAFLDGATLWKVFFKLDLHLLKPILAMVAILQFQGTWSDFFWPLITVIGNPDVYTLPLMIVGFRAVDSTYYGQYCAGLVFMTVPIVLVYCCFSKYFMEGMAVGAVKG